MRKATLRDLEKMKNDRNHDWDEETLVYEAIEDEPTKKIRLCQCKDYDACEICAWRY